MSDEPSFDFLPWEELSVGVRRNRKKMYNYIVSVLNGDEPGPTPTSTGTVTVTCQRVLDDETVPVGEAYVMLYTGDTPPSQQDDSNMVGLGQSGNDGVAVIYTYDTTAHQPTQVTDIPFGTYNVLADGGICSYTGTLTVDGDEEVTITLTE